MKQPHTIALRASLCFFLSFVLIQTTFAQPIYTVRNDPANSKRKIIDIKPATRKLSTVIQTRNALDAVKFKRPELPFKAFEMRHPKTGKELNPNAIITIKYNDSVQKKATVKEFFDELNAMEKALTARGRTLRVASTFTDLKPGFVAGPYLKEPKLPAGYNRSVFKTNSNPRGYAINGKPLYIKPLTENNLNTNAFKMVDWEPALYIADRYSNHGTTEFPAEWVKSSMSDGGRSIFPLILEVPKGIEPLIKRIDWQVSVTPFDDTWKEVNIPGLKKTGTVPTVSFSKGIRGVDILPAVMKSVYAPFYVDLSQVEPVPQNTVKYYFIRAIAYSAANDVLKISPQVVAAYGFKPSKLKIAVPEVNSVPGFNYSFPSESSIPFGLFIKGEGFTTKKTTKYTDPEFENLATTGFKFSGKATLGLRYFNFMSIVNDNEPSSKELNVLKAHFNAVAGMGTSPTGQNEAQGIRLDLDIMDGLYKPSIDFSTKVPGTDNISLDYTISEPINWELVNTRFFIGPVPMKISASVGGEAGIQLSGFMNTANFEMKGSIRPYLKTYFTASGGVDAIIAYATLNAEVNPLLEINMPVLVSSQGKALDFTNNIAALNGRVYLAVGFYYPCPSLEKIVGWLSGDEDLPLCECKWEYNIFDFKGYNETFKY